MSWVDQGVEGKDKSEKISIELPNKFIENLNNYTKLKELFDLHSGEDT